MKVLVTGGAGYVGSAVVEALLAAGHEVAVFDNLAKGHRESLAGLPVTFCAGDLARRDEIDAALRQTGAEAVIHTAGSIEAGELMKNPGKYYRDNVVNSINLLDSMVENGVDRFVFSSSAGVYGNPTRVPIEEDDPMAPENCYGETKLAVERAASWYGRVGVKSVFLRYFNAAGATDRLGEAHSPETLRHSPLPAGCPRPARPLLHLWHRLSNRRRYGGAGLRAHRGSGPSARAGS